MGNICRSPAAEGVFRALVDEAGISNHFHIDSAGTIGYHAGHAAAESWRNEARSAAAGETAGDSTASISTAAAGRGPDQVVADPVVLPHAEGGAEPEDPVLVLVNPPDEDVAEAIDNVSAYSDR